MAANLIQTAGRVGDNDHTDPESCTFDSVGAVRYDQVKLTPFMIRGQVKNAGDLGAGGLWKCYYNDTNNRGTAVQVGAALDGDIQVESVDGLPTDGDNAGTFICGDLTDPPDSLDFQEGKYDEVDASVGKISLSANHFTEHQFCVQFTALAQNDTRYYFWVIPTAGLNDVTGLIRVETEAVASGPKGVLGHPLNGPFRGPV